MVGIAIVIVLLATPPILNWLHARYSGMDSGHLVVLSNFSDLFAFTTALFSGLAFAGVLIALWMQREELALQRKELRRTRRVMGQQEKELRALASAVVGNEVGTGFFQIIEHYNRLIDVLEFDREAGRSAFRKWWTHVNASANQEGLHDTIDLTSLNMHDYGEKCQERRRRIEEFVTKQYSERGLRSLRIYYLTAAEIIRYLQRIGDRPESERYFRLTIAQFSDWELALFFYIALSNIERDGFLELATNHCLFDGLPARYFWSPIDQQFASRQLPSIDP